LPVINISTLRVIHEDHRTFGSPSAVSRIQFCASPFCEGICDRIMHEIFIVWEQLSIWLVKDVQKVVNESSHSLTNGHLGWLSFYSSNFFFLFNFTLSFIFSLRWIFPSLFSDLIERRETPYLIKDFTLLLRTTDQIRINY